MKTFKIFITLILLIALGSFVASATTISKNKTTFKIVSDISGLDFNCAFAVEGFVLKQESPNILKSHYRDNTKHLDNYYFTEKIKIVFVPDQNVIWLTNMKSK